MPYFSFVLRLNEIIKKKYLFNLSYNLGSQKISVVLNIIIASSYLSFRSQLVHHFLRETLSHHPVEYRPLQVTFYHILVPRSSYCCNLAFGVSTSPV